MSNLDSKLAGNAGGFGTFDSALAELEGHGGESSRKEFDQAACAVVEMFPDDSIAYCRIAALYRSRGEPAKGLEFLDRGLLRIGDSLDMIRLGARLSRDVPDFERAILYHRRWADLTGQRASNFVAIAGLHLKMYDGVAAWEALEEAVDAGQSRDALLVKFALAALFKGDHERCRALVEEEERVHGPGQLLTHIATKLAGREHIAKARPRTPQRLGSGATDELKQFANERKVPPGVPDTFPDHFATEVGDIVGERVPGSRSLVLIFGGLKAMAAGTLPTLKLVLERARINTLLLSDPQRLLGLGGIWSIGNYRESIGWLEGLMDAWQISDLYCFGTSAGGYPAIRYGLDLHARRILTFAAPTKITADLLARNEDSRAKAVLGRLLRHVPEMCVNLRTEIARLGEAAPEIINYHGADMPQDAFHARNIEGLPTVRSRPFFPVSPGMMSLDFSRRAAVTPRHFRNFCAIERRALTGRQIG